MVSRFNQFLYDLSQKKYRWPIIIALSVAGLAIGLSLPFFGGAVISALILVGAAFIGAYAGLKLLTRLLRKFKPRLDIEGSVEQKALADAKNELKRYSSRILNPKAKHRQEALEIIRLINSGEVSTFSELLKRIEPFIGYKRQGKFIAALENIQNCLSKENIYNFEHKTLLEFVIQYHPHELNSFYKAYLVALQYAAFNLNSSFMKLLNVKQQSELASVLYHHIVEEKDWLLLKKIMNANPDEQWGYALFYPQIYLLLEQQPSRFIELIEGLKEKNYIRPACRLLKIADKFENLSAMVRQYLIDCRADFTSKENRTSYDNKMLKVMTGNTFETEMQAESDSKRQVTLENKADSGSEIINGSSFFNQTTPNDSSSEDGLDERLVL